MAALLIAALLSFTTPQPAAPSTCWEDMPCWQSAEMGNRHTMTLDGRILP